MIIGIVDDDIAKAMQYKEIFEINQIETHIFEDDFSEKIILDWIIEKKVECLIVDYKLVEKSTFLGTELIFYIENTLNSFPCILLTAFPEEAKSKKIVNPDYIYSKEVMIDEGKDFTSFIEMIKKSAMIFKERIKINENKYSVLVEKQKKTNLDADEKNEMIKQYRILKSYGIIESIPEELLDKTIEAKINKLIEKLDNIMEK